MNKKKLISGVVLAVLVVSLCGNLYTYGYRWAFNKGFQAGMNQISNAVVAQYKQTGKVEMQLEEGKTVTLVSETHKPSSKPLQSLSPDQLGPVGVLPGADASGS